MSDKKKNKTPYDDVHRTLITDCKQLVIPMVNEVFHEDYTGTEEVILVQNEIFMHQQDMTEKRVQDSSFVIVAEDGNRKWYHLECQSTIDGKMILRMYEYDSQVAIQNAVCMSQKLEITFPHSAIVYLRHNSNTPDKMLVALHTPGGTISYEVPVIKAQTYSVDEIFEKQLYYLIPFHIFAYENKFGLYESDKSKLEEQDISKNALQNGLAVNGATNDVLLLTPDHTQTSGASTLKISFKSNGENIDNTSITCRTGDGALLIPMGMNAAWLLGDNSEILLHFLDDNGNILYEIPLENATDFDIDYTFYCIKKQKAM